ncbi:MAG: polysaccharide biosynthesis protein [Chloroflexi bacterium]|nr:polysaccharide biosynthesis protein [Chloroflexota bacterium]
MEDNVADAVTNNILGTWNLIRLAKECAVERFMLVSTDKAVNPVSVMGMTKRVAELLVLRPKEVSKGWFRWLRLKLGVPLSRCVSATC